MGIPASSITILMHIPANLCHLQFALYSPAVQAKDTDCTISIVSALNVLILINFKYRFKYIPHFFRQHAVLNPMAVLSDGFSVFKKQKAAIHVGLLPRSFRLSVIQISPLSVFSQAHASSSSNLRHQVYLLMADEMAFGQ